MKVAEHKPAEDAQARVPRDPAASMALLFDTIRRPVDPLYADRAKRRKERGEKPARVSTPLSVVALLLIGLIIGTGSATLRQPKAVVRDNREQLVKQVEERQATNDTNAKDIEQLRQDVTVIQEAALGRTSKGGLADMLKTAEAEASLTPVSGSGVVLTLSNPSNSGSVGNDSNPRTRGQSLAITSTDLQQVVNAYYEAGAQAIAINDQRLSTVSAIRFAGSAVLVNYRPLTPPYRVSVLGGDGVQSRFAAGPGGQYVAGLKKAGFGASSQKTNVTLPASPSTKLSYAQVAH